MDRRQFIRSSTAAIALAGAGVRIGRAGESTQQPGKVPIPRRILGKTGEKVPVLILGGVAAMKDPPTEKFHPAQLAEAALNAGINYFDTAAAYGDGQSERNYGEVLATRRKEVFLATKTGDRSYEGVMRGVEGSLKRLQTDRVDLLQVHGVSAKEDFTRWDKPDGVMKALRELREQKVTRFIGVTGHESAEAMRRVIELFDFDTILTTFNPTARRLSFQQLVLPVAKEKGMGILAMKIMGGGFGSLAVGNPIKNDLDKYWYHDQAQRQAEAGTLIRYVLGLPVSAAIVGMGSLEQLQVNVTAVCNAQPLDEAQRKELERHMA